MTIHARYQQLVDKGELAEDEMQQRLITDFDRLATELTKASSIFAQILHHLNLAHPPKGLYLWGGVGAGKTMLMDLFYHSVEGVGKKRQHYHAFMLDCHQALQNLKGHKEPIDKYVSQLAVHIKLLCLDEFFVQDIADAMILTELLFAFERYGIVLVTTSNCDPDKLYENGLQREKFIPTIAWIKQHLQVLACQVTVDYRLQAFDEAGVFFSPCDKETGRLVQTIFDKLHGGEMVSHSPVQVANRDIPVVASAANCIWFRFDCLCESARSQMDYVSLSDLYPVIIVSDVPSVKKFKADALRRFITMIDIFYEKKVDVVIQAGSELSELENLAQMIPEFSRTFSRLQEMQTSQYLSQAHQSI